VLFINYKDKDDLCEEILEVWVMEVKFLQNLSAFIQVDKRRGVLNKRELHLSSGSRLRPAAMSMEAMTD
jgi:hypothetical protein